MAKKVEDIIRGAGLFQSLITLLVEKVKEIGGTVEDIYWLITPSGAETLRQVAQVIVEAKKKIKGITTTTLAELISLGKYDEVNSNINEENFPIDEPINPNEEARLFHFDREMLAKEVEIEMAKEGWKPAKIWHLLLFGVKYPESQRQFPIVALDSIWRGLVPCLHWFGTSRKRSLFLGELGDGWFGSCRFLAVRATSISQLIALGKFYWVDPDITVEHFPIDEPINPNEEARLFNFDREMSIEEIEIEMAKEGWKPAKIWHLLLFCAKYPEVQKQFPIVAPGSVWRGLVPYIRWGVVHRERNLDLDEFNSGWCGSHRFLAVRK